MLGSVMKQRPKQWPIPRFNGLTVGPNTDYYIIIYFHNYNQFVVRMQ